MIRNSRYNLSASTCEVNTAPSETVQEDAQSVYDLFQRMVLGQYTPSIALDEDYDFSSREGEVDLDSIDSNLNRISFTREEAYQLSDHYSDVLNNELNAKKIVSDAPNLSSDDTKTSKDTGDSIE